MQLTDWPLVEVTLMLIGLTHISFGSLGTDQSSFRLPAQSFVYFFNPPSGIQRKSTSGQYYTLFSCKESKKERLSDVLSCRFS